MQTRRAGLAAVWFLACWPAVAQSGEAVLVGTAVPVANRIPIEQVDHRAWDTLLKNYVDHRGDVNYRAWRADRADIKRLDAYLGELSRADLRQQAPRAAGLAYWINAYNAVTIRGILREYPTTSIRNHTAKLYGYNIWKDLKLLVGAQRVSLEAIEHQILRKSKEPRIHFAIVCASRSCPRLRNQAFTAENVEELLASSTREFFAQPGNFRFDAGENRFYLSSIMKWFAADFGDDRAKQLQWLAPHLADPRARAAAATGRGAVRYLPYDWKLNDQATARAARRQ